jgi:hypothetical protein
MTTTAPYWTLYGCIPGEGTRIRLRGRFTSHYEASKAAEMYYQIVPSLTGVIMKRVDNAAN